MGAPFGWRTRSTGRDRAECRSTCLIRVVDSDCGGSMADGTAVKGPPRVLSSAPVSRARRCPGAVAGSSTRAPWAYSDLRRRRGSRSLPLSARLSDPSNGSTCLHRLPCRTTNVRARRANPRVPVDATRRAWRARNRHRDSAHLFPSRIAAPSGRPPCRPVSQRSVEAAIQPGKPRCRIRCGTGRTR